MSTLFAAVAVLILSNQPSKADSTFDFDIAEFSSASAGDEAHVAVATGEGPQGMGANVTSDATGKQIEVAQVTRLGLLTSGTIGGYTSIPSGQFSFGFGGGGALMFSSAGGTLPPTSTSSVDLSITSGW